MVSYIVYNNNNVIYYTSVLIGWCDTISIMSND
jgi:hypothetical protein